MSVLKSLFVENTSSYREYSSENVSMAEEALEVAEGYNDIVSTNDAIERLDEIHESLESLIELSEDSLEHGGLTAETAQILKISTEALVAPLGMSTPILSVESFGGDSERLTSTRISIEDGKTTLQKIWDAIEGAMRSLRDKISKWYDNMLKNVDKVLDKVKAVKEEVGKLEGSPKKKTVKYNLDKLITSGQKTDDVTVNLTTLSDMLSAIVSKEPISLANSILTSFKSLDAKNLKEGDAEEFIDAIKADVKKYTQMSSRTKDNKEVKSMASVDSEVTVTKHKPLPGNKAAFSYYSEKDPKKCDWKIGPDSDDGKVSNEEISVPNKASLTTIMDIVEKMVNTMKTSKGDLDGYRKVKDDVMDAGKNMVRDAKGTDGAKVATKLVGELRVASNILNNPVNGLMNNAFSSSASALKYVNAMVKAYK